MFSKKLFNNNQNSSGGGSGGPTNWGSIGGNINNQIDLKGQLNDKANKTELATKADKSELQTITQELNTKADVSQLNDKADKTELATKADKSELPAIATNNNVGLVKPDGTTITITSEGVISSSGDTTNWGSISGDINNQTDLKNKLADKADKTELPTVATTDKPGIVKPDGTTITITSEGVISSSGGPTNWGSIGGDIDNQTDLKNKLADKANKSELQTITQELNTKANVSQLNDKADRSELPAIATNNNIGLVKPDGTTITITSEGVISSSGSPTNWGSISGDINNQTDLKNKLADKADKTELPAIATNNNVGLVKPDGTTITISDDGTISSVGDTTIPITPLTYAETINLEVDKVYKLVATGNVTFVLPTVETPTTLPQILIQFKMATPVTINLGTTNFFKKTAPDMSISGMYNIIYEYDVNNNAWVVDAIIKGETT